MLRLATVATVATFLLVSAHAYDFVKEYSGPNFFNDWDFYGSWCVLQLVASANAKEL